MYEDKEETQFIRLAAANGRQDFIATERRRYRTVRGWLFWKRRVERGPPVVTTTDGIVLEPTRTLGEYFHPTLKIVLRKITD